MGEFEEAHQYLGKLHMKMKEFDRAVESFRRCLELRPESALSTVRLDSRSDWVSRCPPQQG
jgi:uncharacterized protein HemY